MVEDLTTLFTAIYAGEDEHAPLYAMGQLYFDLKDLLKLIASMGVPHKWWELWKWPPKSAKATAAFSDFAFKRYQEDLSQ